MILLDFKVNYKDWTLHYSNSIKSIIVILTLILRFHPRLINSRFSTHISCGITRQPATTGELPNTLKAATTKLKGCCKWTQDRHKWTQGLYEWTWATVTLWASPESCRAWSYWLAGSDVQLQLCNTILWC